MRQKPTGIFDTILYGVFLRSHRRAAGFTRAQDFCMEVCDKTNVTINKETLYRIETGVQNPSIDQLIAFSKVLHPDEPMEKALALDGVFLSIR